MVWYENSVVLPSSHTGSMGGGAAVCLQFLQLPKRVMAALSSQVSRREKV